MPSVDELNALARASKPSWMWNKYKEVKRDKDDRVFHCAYRQLFRANDYWDCDVDWCVDTYTEDERYQLCGFDDMEHYLRVSKEYADNKVLSK